MAFGKLLGGMFSRKKTIKSVTADDLHKERIGLENEERRLVKELVVRGRLVVLVAK